MGVWIETLITCWRFSTPRSPLIWGCGLKQQRGGGTEHDNPSLPIWGCGLKQNLTKINIFVHVTPYMGVWIETNEGMRIVFTADVTPYMGVWIETQTGFRCYPSPRVTPYMGGVD